MKCIFMIKRPDADNPGTWEVCAKPAVVVHDYFGEVAMMGAPLCKVHDEQVGCVGCDYIDL